MRGSLTTTEQNQQIKEHRNLLAVARVAIYPVSAQGVAIQTAGDASDQSGIAERLPRHPLPASLCPPVPACKARAAITINMARSRMR